MAEHPPVVYNGRTYYWQAVSKWCWYYISGYMEDGEKIAHYLHREVWKDAHGYLSPGMIVHHKDGHTDNNDISNLELLTPRQHALLHANEKVELVCSICGNVFLKTRRNHEHDEPLGIKPVCSKACHSNSPHAKEKKRQWYLEHRQLTIDRARARELRLKGQA